MPKKLKNLEDLFQDELKDLYSAEKQMIAALPKMAKEATDSQLKKAFESHLQETKIHKERLEKIFEIMELKAGSKKCEAMAGLVEEGKEMIEEDASPETKDAGLIACAQRIEHYEIAGYGTAAHFADRLGHKQAFQLLTQTLNEEQKADTTLNEIAKKSVNQKAMAHA